MTKGERNYVVTKAEEQLGLHSSSPSPPEAGAVEAAQQLPLEAGAVGAAQQLPLEAGMFWLMASVPRRS